MHLSLQIFLDFLLEQVQVQLAQSIWTQTTAVEAGLVADQADAFQLVGDFVEAARMDAIGPQALEEQERFEGRVGGIRGGHLLALRSMGRGLAKP